MKTSLMRTYLLIPLFVASFLMGCKKDHEATLAVVTTTDFTNITSNSAQGGGESKNDGGSPITKRGVSWATHAAPTVGDSTTSDGTGAGAFISTLENLASNTTYHARAYVINGVGTGY